MKKDEMTTILLFCVLVLCLGIAIVLASDMGDETGEGEVGSHAHDEYVEKTGDTMTGDLLVQNLHANEVINGDGSGIWNLNASKINIGTIDSARLPSNIDADTLDDHDSSDFSMAAHTHDDRYYTKTESDDRFALISHTHPPGDADTLDDYDSSDFATAAHIHDERYHNKTESDNRYAFVGHVHLPGNADTLDDYDSTDFAMAAHTHDDRYYNKTESDNRYAQISHIHPPGDADTLDGYDSTDFAMAAHTHLPGDADTLDGYDSTDFAMAAHTHDASHITSGELDEARLPQNAIDDSEIEIGLGLVPSGTIVMWNGTSIPNGWALCDGTNGTPDLRGMFIVGYDSNDSDYNTIGITGGEKTHILTVNEMPQHQHSFSGSTSTNGNHQHSYEDSYWDPGGGGLTVDENDPMSSDDNMIVNQNKWSNSEGAHSHTFSGDTDPTGGNVAHENRPPYYVMAFIMKL